MAILKDQWRQTFGGDSPLKKWRFWKLWGRRQKVAILGRKLAILGQKLAIFGPFLGGKISTDLTLNFRQTCVPKKWRFWGEICSKVAISGLKVVGAKSGDFGTLKWRSRKNKIGGPALRDM